MTLIRDLRRTPVRRDYRSAGLGVADTAMLVSDLGAVVVNSLRDATWSVDGFQVHLCGSCGVEGCEVGGWVTARRYGAAVAWVPAFDLMAGGAWESDNHAPPVTGTPDHAWLFLGAAAQTVVASVAGHPAREDLPELTVAEGLAIARLAAPDSCLGAGETDRHRRRALALAADPYPLDDTLDALETLISRGPVRRSSVDRTPSRPQRRVRGPSSGTQRPKSLKQGRSANGRPPGAKDAKSNSSGSAPLEPPPGGTTVATIFLDLAGTPAWTPLGRAPNGRWVLLPFGADSLACAGFAA